MPASASQPVASDLSRAAIFIVADLAEGDAAVAATRALCGKLAALVRSVGFRDLQGGLSCVMGFGSSAWDRVFGGPRPRDLHPFVEIDGVHHAPATQGDLFFHIRAMRADLCFALAAQVVERLADAVTAVDEVHGFTWFDDRDLIGFVDGTENPTGAARVEAVTIGDEDPGFAGGSYVIVQKYLHDLKGWNALAVEEQERIVGRTKLDDIEFDDDAKAPYAHNVLTSIEEGGVELKIVRDNMPFGNAGAGEFGTYFCGYARSPARIERMLRNMFVGDPPGTYDRLLDYSRAVTGSLFFVPAEGILAKGAG